MNQAPCVFSIEILPPSPLNSHGYVFHHEAKVIYRAQEPLQSDILYVWAPPRPLFLHMLKHATHKAVASLWLAQGLEFTRQLHLSDLLRVWDLGFTRQLHLSDLLRV
jgi:hypothetical protein